MLEITFGKRNIQAYNPKASWEFTAVIRYPYTYVIAGITAVAFSLLLTRLLLMGNVN